MLSALWLLHLFVVASAEDWSSSCPRGWQDLGDGNCLAPLSYRGPCGTSLRIDPLWGESEKKEISEACAVSWPSYLECPAGEMDLSGCLPGWVYVSGLCHAPLSHGGGCSLATMTPDGAENIEEITGLCGQAAQPRCKSSCAAAEDYGAKCPEAWAFTGAWCVAPAGYIGPCLPLQSFENFSKMEKREWSHSCLAPFPCAVSTSCDVVGACPADWEPAGDLVEYCVAPATYKGPCRPVFQAAELRRLGYDKVEESCGVKWECILHPDTTSDSPAKLEPLKRDGPISGEGAIIPLTRAV